MATGTPWRATATTSAIDKERPSSVIVAGMRKGSYCSEIRDAKSRRASREKRHEKASRNDAVPCRSLVTPFRDAAVYFEATALPLGAGRLDGASSGFPGSVCTLQSKITYWRLTAVTRSAA